MNIPADLKFTKEHEWIKVDGDTATIGITDYAQSELGELVYVEVDTIGDELAQNDVFGTVEAVKTTSDLFMPVSGTVLEMNPELDENEGDNPTAINEDPYGKGWIIKVKMVDKAELDTLLDAEAYKAFIS
ncbi:MAG TPA: glycine cleavage system protein GcvH [Saprospiraceae bacterium]|nr:glycine cleavage system protein GcvH [Saprospiraceae bacterium]